jgi:hypothetical protein
LAFWLHPLCSGSCPHEPLPSLSSDFCPTPTLPKREGGLNDLLKKTLSSGSCPHEPPHTKEFADFSICPETSEGRLRTPKIISGLCPESFLPLLVLSPTSFYFFRWSTDQRRRKRKETGFCAVRAENFLPVQLTRCWKKGRGIRTAPGGDAEIPRRWRGLQQSTRCPRLMAEFTNVS